MLVTVPAASFTAVETPRDEKVDGVELVFSTDVTGFDLSELWMNLSNHFDVNADGHVSPIDDLVIINELNDQ